MSRSHPRLRGCHRRWSLSAAVANQIHPFKLPICGFVYRCLQAVTPLGCSTSHSSSATDRWSCSTHPCGGPLDCFSRWLRLSCHRAGVSAPTPYFIEYHEGLPFPLPILRQASRPREGNAPRVVHCELDKGIDRP